MNKAIIQLCELFISPNEILSDGCSIHIDESSYDNYYQNALSLKEERHMGKPFDILVSDSLFSKLKESKNFRFSEIELNNLLSFQELIINNG
jgi:hypothetical protein